MSEKKPVYNGYDEQYVNGVKLKEIFKEHYYSTRRHHAVVLGISIPDYLELIDIKDTTEYRIFINEHFCKVLDINTDKEITFFGHTTLSKVKLSKNISDVQLDKICPDCGSAMKFKSGKFGEFLGCSDYPKCRKTINIPIIGNYEGIPPMRILSTKHKDENKE